LAQGPEVAMMDKIRQLIGSSSKILVFTGAGLSTGSGIADFRGPSGVWTRRQPVQFDEFLSSESKRIEHWNYKLEGWADFRAALPNAAHKALLELERRGQMRLLVTQNIDGLHHVAGHAAERVVELHGTNRLVECLSCGLRSEPQWAFDFFQRTGRCPFCAECGGFVKTATISFGQAMQSDLMDRALEAAEECDLVLALGSTLSVQPAASVPLQAARRVPYVVINRGATDHDRIATHRLDGDLMELLPDLLS